MAAHYGLLNASLKIGNKNIEIQYINYHPLIDSIIYSAHLSNLINDPELILANFDQQKFLTYLKKYHNQHSDVFDVENYFQSFPELQLLEIYASLWTLTNKIKKIVELVIVDELGVVLYNFSPSFPTYEQICIYKKDDQYYPAIIREKIYNSNGKITMRNKELSRRADFLNEQSCSIKMNNTSKNTLNIVFDKQIYENIKFIFC